MLFKLHYVLSEAAHSALGVLMGVYIKTYTDASSLELGFLLMLRPFTDIFIRPILCSYADRKQAHQSYLVWCLLTVTIGYSPFIIIPCLGPRVYVEHARLCWYIFLALMLVGDIALGGIKSLGDALAINHAERMGIDFHIYRIWQTSSGVFFSLVISQVNEISFMPLYVPAYIILTVFMLIELIIIWLWPPEYFVIVSQDQGLSERTLLHRSPLMPKALVLAHMRDKLVWLATCGFCARSTRSERKRNNSPPNETCQPNQGVDLSSAFGSMKSLEEKEEIDRRMQLRILASLFRKDLRIPLYLIYFVCAGMSLAPLPFFFVRLADICHEKGRNFSQLFGFMEGAHAGVRVVLFIYMRRLIAVTGRVNMCAIAIFLIAIKHLFYATVWLQLDPYYAILAETLHGLAFGVYLTVTIEMGHLFANEVKFVLPNFIARGDVKNEQEAERLKLSLAATMQSLMASALDGVGRGSGALILGALLEVYSYETVWFIIAVSGFTLCTIIVLINITDRVFRLNLGLDRISNRVPRISKRKYNVFEMESAGKLHYVECIGSKTH